MKTPLTAQGDRHFGPPSTALGLIWSKPHPAPEFDRGQGLHLGLQLIRE
jgi:hypothetical protein